MQSKLLGCVCHNNLDDSQVVDFAGKRDARQLILMKHKAHHVAEFLDSIGGLFRIFDQSTGIKGIQGIE